MKKSGMTYAALALIAGASLTGCGSQAAGIDGAWARASMADMDCAGNLETLIIKDDKAGILLVGQVVRLFEGLERTAEDDGSIVLQSGSDTFRFMKTDRDHMTYVSGPSVSGHFTSDAPVGIVRCPA